VPVPSVDDRVDNLIGDSIGSVLSSALDEAMKAVWEAATWLLSTAFSVVDDFSTFTVDAQAGPVGAIWPTLLAVSSAIALGLFFWQLTLAALRGGRGMMRAATGPVAYGIALAMTVTGIAAALATADGLTALILSKGLNVTTFSGAFTHTTVLGQVGNEVKVVALGLVGLLGVIPAAIGWVLEIIWRQAAILVLVSTVPITAAGLLAHTTASWFWRGLRWTLAAIAVKPVLALIVVIGVSSLANASGPVGLLAGVAVLWVSLTSPIALFRLLAFVDPATSTGDAFRDSFSQITSRISDLAGADAGSGSGGGGSGTSSAAMGEFESANTARFDAAGVGADGSGASPPDPDTQGGSEAVNAADHSGTAGDSATGDGSTTGTSGSASSTGGTSDGGAGADPGGSPDGYSASPEHAGGGAEPPQVEVSPPAQTAPEPHSHTAAPAGESGSGGAAAGAADGAIEAGVIL